MAVPLPPAGQPAITSSPGKDWDTILDQTPCSIWVFLKKDQDTSESARGWYLAVECSDRQMVAIFPTPNRETGELRITCLLMQTSARTKESAWSHLVRITQDRFGRPFLRDITLRDVLDILDRSGLSSFALRDERGLRHWLLTVLSLLQPYLKEAKMRKTLTEDAVRIMRRCHGMKLDGTGSVDIVKGAYKPHKLSGKALKALTACNAKIQHLIDLEKDQF
ncbi:hypothetical protein F4778DRAFT_263754 [Xylariomycetidae sp. FL2044]|nr:hypothetical protein F4778DRAFT_263754 [Xylariomycetidae sp. FL2044]